MKRLKTKNGIWLYNINKKNNMKTPNNDTLSNQTGIPTIEHKQDDYNEQFEKTPIWIRGNNEIGYFATIGNAKISDNHRTLEEIEYKLYNRDYDLLMNIIVTLIDKVNEVKKLDNEGNKP